LKNSHASNPIHTLALPSPIQFELKAEDTEVNTGGSGDKKLQQLFSLNKNKYTTYIWIFTKTIIALGASVESSCSFISWSHLYKKISNKLECGD
jgi:hypothetical protein